MSDLNLEEQLRSAYPTLFDDSWCEVGVGEGWHQLVKTLCGVIDNRRKFASTKVDVKVRQIKEKFGGLRFYIDGGDDGIWGAIALAEELSLHMCEECGAPGKQVSPRGWIKTKCEEHAK